MISFNKLKKNLQKNTDGLKKISLAVLADNASQLTVQAIKGYGIEEEICFDVYEADYNQVDAEISNPASGLYRHQPAFVLINLSTEHLLKKFYSGNREDFAEREVAYIQSICNTFASRCPGKIILTNFIEINDGV